MDYKYFHCASEEYIQNNLEDLILGMIRLVIDIHHSMLELIF